MTAPARTPRIDWSLVLTLVVLGGSVLLLLAAVQPALLVADNTPTGGDMGAHVYGPAYLRDVLLPDLRLNGWSNDWYAGFPIYRFYMVLPALLVLLVDLVLPYGIALKLVAVSGILTMPIATWAFARLARLPRPAPELLVLGSLVFLFDESFTIYGGNIASTMAGEFSFSISLTLAMVAFGLVARALREGRGARAAAAVLALSALSHGIVLLFVFGGVVLLALLHLDAPRARTAAWIVGVAVLLSAFWVLPFVGNHAYMTDMKYEPQPSGAGDSFWKMFFPLPLAWDVVVGVLAVVGFAGALVRRRLVVAWMGITALVVALGVVVARRSLPVIGLLWNPRLLPFLYLLRYFLAFLGAWELVAGAWRWWSVERALRAGTAPSAPAPAVERTVAALAAALVVVVLGVRFQELPGGRVVTDDAGNSTYEWGPISTAYANDGFVDGWARWNFSGYEGKSAYAEYRDLVATMQRLGDDPVHGCGRALWENNGDLNKYGTTMALMLLPHWTDGCIGSMEGLFFEASGTTPYHFIAAAAMSKQSSNPVRELRYDDNDAGKGVRYLRELGVRYYMAFTPEAVAQARTQAALVEVATSGPWVVYEVDGADPVVPLDVEPVVVPGRSGVGKEPWLELGTSWFQHPEDWPALPVADGPASWQRVDAEVDLSRREGEPGESYRRVDVVVPSGPVEARALAPVIVSDVRTERQGLTFTVDRPGVPVVVRTSYFPGWRASGADGPWRAAPNLMVVVPTSTTVRLEYGRTIADHAATALSVVGLGVVAWGPRPLRRRRPRPAADARG